MALTPAINPFDPPNYDDDRGLRRLITNLRKALMNFDNAYHEARETESVENQGMANKLRLEMISLYDELLLHNPAESCVSVQSNRQDVLERATTILARCPSFTEVQLSGTRLSPPLASTISMPDTPEPHRTSSNSAPFTYSMSHLIGQLQTSCLGYEIATDPNMNEDPSHVNAMRKSLVVHRRDLEERINDEVPSSAASAAIRRASILLGEDFCDEPILPVTNADSSRAPGPVQSQFPSQSLESNARMNVIPSERDRSSHRENESDNLIEQCTSLREQLRRERCMFDERLRNERRRQDEYLRQERIRHELEIDELMNTERRRFDDELSRVRDDNSRRASRRAMHDASLVNSNRNNNRANLYGTGMRAQVAPPPLCMTQREQIPMDVEVTVVSAPARGPSVPSPTLIYSAPIMSTSVVPGTSSGPPVTERPMASNEASPSVSKPRSIATVASTATVTASSPLLDIQTQSHAYSMLVQRRPKSKFSGETKKLDFEAFLHRFEAMTAVPGSTDAMRLGEMPFWFTGSAALIVDRFVSESDATKGLSMAIKALKKEFGRKTLTAKQMLQEILVGDKIPEKDFTALKTFALRLEKSYQIAIETRRQGTFDLPETINDVIRSKLPHLAVNWAKKVSETEATMLESDDVPELTFQQFVSFVKKQISIAETTSEILKNPDTHKTVPKVPIRIAAHDALKPSSSKVPMVQQHTLTQPARSDCPSRCAVCPKSMHHTSDCRKFASMAAVDKGRVVKTKGLCIRCLGTRHLLKDCSSNSVCRECGSPHHSAMHGVSLYPKVGGKGDGPSS